MEVERSLRVLDGAIALFDSVAGVEPQSETVWRQADKYRVPRIAFINKMDRIGADFARGIQTMIDRLHARPLPLQIPVGAEDQFRGIVDLVRMVAYMYDDDMGVEWRETPVPEDLAELAAEQRSHMIEMLADTDEAVMVAYLEGEEIGEEQLRAAIRKATLDIELVPVLCGSAFKNKGVQMLLDAVIDYLPAPTDVPPVVGIEPKTGAEVVREASDDAPFSALAFKIMSDPFVGKLTFFRVYSGTMSAGSYVYNSTKGKRERVGRILQMHANHREDRTEVYAGDIAAAVGLKSTTTGDTLTAPDHPVILESIEFPEPVIFVAIEPKTKMDQDRLSESLMKLSEEDPTFRVRTDDETGQTIIAGMGELHLEIIVDRLLREFKVDANVGRPQVAYRETIKQKVEKAEARFVRQTGGRGQYGHVVLVLEPVEPGVGFSFESKIVGGSVPREYIAPVEAGVDRGHGDRGPRRLSDGRRESQPDRRFVPRGRLVRDGVQDRGLHGAQRGGQEGSSDAARASGRGRGRRPRGVHGRRHGRPQFAARPYIGHRVTARRAGDPRTCAPRGDVRLRDRPPLVDARSRDVHHAVQSLRRGPERHCGRARSPAEGRVAGRARPATGTRYKDRNKVSKTSASRSAAAGHLSESPVEREETWRSRSSIGANRTSTWVPSATSTTGRRR